MAVQIYDYDIKKPLHKERFGTLNSEWLTKYFRIEDQDAEAFADPKGYILDEGGVILMAETKDGIIGTGSLMAMEANVYEIAKMAVTDKCQAQGIGEKLMLALITRAKAMGATKLFIISNTKLERAIRLYRRHGFTDSPENRHSCYERGNITLECAL
jgi:GNAT superfamily N-acetyltransferase